MSNELITAVPGREMTVADLKSQVDMIRDAMKSVMVGPTETDPNGVHYGPIPGCGDKYALKLPGAHKLCLLFNLAPEYRIETNDLPGGHREYEVVCVLTRRSDGMFIGQGVGACSTMESKYRYRSENTGALVPKEYWKDRDKTLIGGAEFSTKKLDGQWFICQRVEHDNPADYYNTAKKIACKRAYNMATLTATAASDIFVPDDDIPPEFLGDDEPGKPKEDQRPPIQQPERKSAKASAQEPGPPSTEKQQKMIFAKLKNANIPMNIFEEKFGKLDNLPFSKVNSALEWVQNFEPGDEPPYK